MVSKRIGIVGASGYTGAELLRLSALHGGFDVAVATGETQAGKLAASRYPSLAAAYPNLVFTQYAPEACEGLDLVFLALPHGAAQGIVPELRKKVGAIVDLSADFRLTDPELYPQWYHEAHQCPSSSRSSPTACPSCTETPSSAPQRSRFRAATRRRPRSRSRRSCANGIVEPNGIIVDAASGVSGAGVGLKENTAFCTVDEDFVAYGLLDHRHTPEMEQVIGASVLFTPHLAPMNRGILATCYARPAAGTTPTTESLLAVLARALCERAVRRRAAGASLDEGDTRQQLRASHRARFDARTGWVMVIAAIDNLVKGASGGAVQCANLVLGLPETTGLPTVGLHP